MIHALEKLAIMFFSLLTPESINNMQKVVWGQPLSITLMAPINSYDPILFPSPSCFPLPTQGPFHQRHHHSFVWVATSPPACCRRLSSYSWHSHLSITSHFCPPLRTCRDARCLHELIFPCHCPPLGVNRLNQTTLVLEPNRRRFMA